MARLCTEFEIKVMVPDWEYCNIRYQDRPNNLEDSHCDFASKYSGAYYCRLFEGMPLYSHDERIKKCEKCQKACGVNG